jgi:hypothetical protein
MTRPALGRKPHYRLFYVSAMGGRAWSCAIRREDVGDYYWTLGPWSVSSAEAIRRAPR